MTHTLTIAKRSFTVEPRYSEGHVLTANEANVLNQTFYENLRNNFAKMAADGKTQEDFDKYAAAYQFGVRVGGSGGSTRDPVQAEALRIAKERIKAKLVSMGKKLADFTAAKLTELANGLIAKDPTILDLAKSMVEARQQSAVAELDESEIDAILSAGPVEGETDASADTDGDGTVSPDENAPRARGRRG